MKYKIEKLSNNRSQIYCIATCWIVLFHSNFSINETLLMPLSKIKQMGGVGVDIFLFMSGVSLFFAFRKSNLKEFYLRRFRRIYVPTLLVGIPYFFVKDFLLSDKGILQYLADVLCIGIFLDGNRTVWYIAAILIFYLLYPGFYAYFNRAKWSTTSYVCILTMVLILNYEIQCVAPMFWGRIDIIMGRFPIFITGVFFGKKVYDKQNVNITKKSVLIGFLFAICLYNMAIDLLHFDGILLYYTLGAMAVPISFFLSEVDFGKVKKYLVIGGEYSLEIYLVHEKILHLMSLITGSSSFYINTIVYAITAVAAIILKMVEALVWKIWSEVMERLHHCKH